MKKTDWHYILVVMAILFLIAAIAGSAQTCSTANPCVQVSITNPNTLPGSTMLFTCMGSASSCSLTALNALIAQQTPAQLCPQVQTVWHCNQFSQTKTPQLYNDPEPYGSLMNYAVQGTNGGGVSAASPILIFQVPAPPAQSPSFVGVPTTVTSGNAGPQ